MKKYTKIIFVVAITISSFSCGKDDEENSIISCNVSNPAENLPWLKTMIENWEANSPIYTYMYVQQGAYSGQTVYLVANCCPFCDSYFPVYNCQGEEIVGANIQDVINLKTIWKPVGFKCTL